MSDTSQSDTPQMAEPGVYVVLDSGSIASINLVSQGSGVFFFGIEFSRPVTDADIDDLKSKISALEPLAQGLGSERSKHVPAGKPRAEC